MTRAWDKEKSESPTGIEPMTSRTPGGRSIHHFHLSQFITIHDDIDIADPSSMQDACHIRTQ